LDEHSDPFNEKAMNMGNVDVMSILMGALLDGQKFLQRMNVGVMGVFYGNPFGWTEILQRMNVDVMGGILWVPFWMDRNVAMNECGCYGCIFMGTLLDGQNFGNEYRNVGWMSCWY
jgi:hypothetical protein